MENVDIKTWFPKPIFKATKILENRLSYFEQQIKEVSKIEYGSKREDMVAVMTFQSANELHLNPAFKEIVDEIVLNAKIFLVELGHLQLINTIAITNMWANINLPGDFLFPHVHNDSILSGVFYVKTYPGSKIHFFDNIGNMAPQPVIRNDLNWDMCSYDCNPGELLMWKSDFIHGTKKQDTGEKIAISFNLR